MSFFQILSWSLARRNWEIVQLWRPWSMDNNGCHSHCDPISWACRWLPLHMNKETRDVFWRDLNFFPLYITFFWRNNYWFLWYWHLFDICICIYNPSIIDKCHYVIHFSTDILITMYYNQKTTSLVMYELCTVTQRFSFEIFNGSLKSYFLVS